MVDSSLPSDNPLRFRKNLLERLWKLIMTIDDKIRIQYNMTECYMILGEKQ